MDRREHGDEPTGYDEKRPLFLRAARPWADPAGSRRRGAIESG
jgi:hypothetical protein